LDNNIQAISERKSKIPTSLDGLPKLVEPDLILPYWYNAKKMQIAGGSSDFTYRLEDDPYKDENGISHPALIKGIRRDPKVSPGLFFIVIRDDGYLSNSIDKINLSHATMVNLRASARTRINQEYPNGFFNWNTQNNILIKQIGPDKWEAVYI